MEILALIPARGGSKRLKNKNIKKLAGKPLITHSIEQAKKSKFINRVIVSTEDKKIKKISMRAGAEIIDRPKKYATDMATTLEVLRHSLKYLYEIENYFPDYLVLVQPTSPLRATKDIDNSIKLMIKHNPDTVISVTETTENPFWMFTIENNKLKKLIEKRYKLKSKNKIYVLNGAIFVLKPALILKEKKQIFGGNNLPYIMPKQRSCDIDTKEDFEVTEKIFSIFTKKEKYSN